MVKGKLLFQSSIFALCVIGMVGCGPNKFEEAAKKNNFLESKDDNEKVPLDKANRLVGKWVTRIALRTAAQALVGTAEFSLAETNGNLYFGDFTWQKIVEPEVKVDSFSGKKTSVTPKALLGATTKAVIPAAHDKKTNHLGIMNVAGNSVKRLVEFSIDFTQDPIISKLANKVTSGIMWVSRDAKTLIGTNGIDLNFIAQRDVALKDIALSDIAGEWDTVGYKLFPKTRTIVADNALTSLTVAAASASDTSTTFSGSDERGRSFDGSIFLVDKTMGASLVDFMMGTVTQEGGILISPDGNYVYGVFFPLTTSSLGDDQFIGVKR